MRILFAAIAVASLAAGAHAQCVNLAVPGLNGCGSFPFGMPTISCGGSPTLGNAAFSITGNTPSLCTSTVPVLILGSCLLPPLTINGPFGVGGFCASLMAPCQRFVGSTIYAGILGAVQTPPNLWTYALPIPNDPTIQGATVCLQQICLCFFTTAGPCVGVSQGISVTIQ